METKHSMTARARKLRPTFFQIGLLTSLSIVLAAFNWTVDKETVQLPPQEESGTYNEWNIGEIKIEEENNQKEKKLTVAPPTPNLDKLIISDKEMKQEDWENTQTVQTTTGTNLFGGRPMGFGEEQEIFEDEELNPEAWVEQMPEYPGGYPEMQKFIKKNIRIPFNLIEDQKGTISISIRAVVEKDGSLSRFEVLKNGGYPEMGEAALQVVKKMPKWKPGYQGIWPARVWVVIPIKVKME